MAKVYVLQVGFGARRSGGQEIGIGPRERMCFFTRQLWDGMMPPEGLLAVHPQVKDDIAASVRGFSRATLKRGA